MTTTVSLGTANSRHAQTARHAGDQRQHILAQLEAAGYRVTQRSDARITLTCRGRVATVTLNL